MFDRLIRYLPALDYIHGRHPQKILEVGSGAKGIGEFFNQKFTGVDLTLDENPVHNMTFVQSSASKLPFDNGEFDLVVCMDVLEHVLEKERGKVMGEMMRVVFGKINQKSNIKNQKYRLKIKNNASIIIGYPCGQGAVALSKKMYAWFQKRGSGTARWMEEHVSFGLPNENFQFIISDFQKNKKIADKKRKFKIKKFNNENILICEWLLKLEGNPRFLKLEKLLFVHFRPLVEFFLRRVNFGPCYRKIWVITTCD